jgi:hypothetical protein
MARPSRKTPCSWEAGDFVDRASTAVTLLKTCSRPLATATVEVALHRRRVPVLFSNPADDTAKWIVMPMRV